MQVGAVQGRRPIRLHEHPICVLTDHLAAAVSAYIGHLSASCCEGCPKVEQAVGLRCCATPSICLGKVCGVEERVVPQLVDLGVIDGPQALEAQVETLVKHLKPAEGRE